jgi:hypothetical protein
MSDSQIAALLAERETYVARKLPGRVAEVDAALAAAGHVVEKATAAPVVETTTKPAARARKAAK